MRRSLPTALLLLVVSAAGVGAQLLDETLVPRGRLRVQADPWFGTWDRRFGVSPDGDERVEQLGQDLTDPTGLLLFPGTATLAQYVQDVGGLVGYEPELGPLEGRVQKDITRVDFGAHVGVFDWLTIGFVVPWVQTRTAVDLSFAPDTVGGGQLGLSPRLTDAASLSAYLGALDASAAAAVASANGVCSIGPSPECTAARSLADRAAAFGWATGAAYSASNLFPVTGSAAATALSGVAAALDTDLAAAGLPIVGLPMVFASGAPSTLDLQNLPVTPGAGIDGFALGTRRELWTTGDAEISALVRLFDRSVGPSAEASGQLTYRLTAGLLVRLPTGTPEHPDIFLDSGSGDGQTDVEWRLLGGIGVGRLALSAGGRYGIQGETTVVKRVAPPERPMPPSSSRRELVWRPGRYLGFEVEPTLRLTDELALIGHVRYFQKDRDEFSLVGAAGAVSPFDLSVESGIKLTQLGGGFRYSTVSSWRSGAAATPVELHVRLMRSSIGGGGQTPVMTRIEGGLRIFRRIWGS